MKRKRKVRRVAGTNNGAMSTKTILTLRTAFIKGMFAAAVLLFVIGAASLDSNPVTGVLLTIVSLAVAAVIYIQNEGGYYGDSL